MGKEHEINSHRTHVLKETCTNNAECDAPVRAQREGNFVPELHQIRIALSISPALESPREVMANS